MESDDAKAAPPAAAEIEPQRQDGAAQKAKPQSKTDEGYRVSLPMFEGPLDLLLHLVQKHELDLLDIPIAFITEKFTAYIRLLDELNIDVASEYLVMAATLVHMKSRLLLPNPPAEDPEESLDDAEMDPRAELVRRLLEYQKYKLAAEQLASRPLLGRDVFGRGSTDAAAAGQPPLESVSMFRLLDAFQSVLERTHRTQDHQIDFDRFSITDKINELSDLLQQKKRLVFHEIFGDRSNRAELIMTFLAILEMTRLRLTRITQDDPLGAIHIELCVPSEDAEPQLAEPYLDATGADAPAEEPSDAGESDHDYE